MRTHPRSRPPFSLFLALANDRKQLYHNFSPHISGPAPWVSRKTSHTVTPWNYEASVVLFRSAAPVNLDSCREST